MKTLIVLVLAVSLAMVTMVRGQAMVPCDPKPGPYSGPSLPVLPDQFRVHVEANIVQKQFTRNMVEYYDYPNNWAVIESYNKQNGERIRSVYDFNNQEARTIYENGTCDFMPTNSSHSRFTFLQGANSSHIKTVRDLLYFSEDMGEVYIGEAMVRGIPVNHWRACVSIPAANGSFTLDYYFTKPEDYSIDGVQHLQIPVRAVINGTGKAMWNSTATPEEHSFYHIYEFTDFHPGPIKDASVYMIPIGTYCHSDVNRKLAPKLPSQFSSGLETMVMDGDEPFSVGQVYYDGLSNVLRVDSGSPGPKEDAMRFGPRPLISIHDEKINNMYYIIDKWEGNCTVMESKTPTRVLSLLNILSALNESYVYQGWKMLRGVQVESWAYYGWDNTVIEVLLKQKQEPGPVRGGNNPYVPLGIYTRKIVGENQPDEVMSYNLFGFTSSHPDPAVFDIDLCYETEHHFSYVMLKIEGSYERHVLHYRWEFVTAVRTALARGAGVSVMRIATISVDADTKVSNQLLVYFKLLDNSLVGYSDNKLPSLAAAKLNLQGAVASGLNFDVQYPSLEQNFEFKRDSLWEIRSTMDQMSSSSSIKRYSAGAMAGLGIGMVVIGALLGLGVAFIIYKRVDTSVPYEITK